MRYRKLGKSGLEVSVICQGCWSLVSEDFNWGGNDPSDSAAAIESSLAAGVNFFDTAEGYGKGESEAILGRVLGARRERVIIADKISPSHLRAAEVPLACERSLKNLGTDYIDLYQVHWPSPAVPLAETMEALEKLRAAGKIRFIGVSNFGPGYLEELDGAGRVESNQVCYNLLWRPIENRLQGACLAREMGILCYSPLAQGLLSGKFSGPGEVPGTRARTRLFSGSRPEARHGEKGMEEEVFRALAKIREIASGAGLPMDALSLAWLLARPGVTSVIAGGRNAAQAAWNAAAGDLEISPETSAALDAATAGLKRLAGDNCDPWEHVSRMERTD